MKTKRLIILSTLCIGTLAFSACSSAPATEPADATAHEHAEARLVLSTPEGVSVRDADSGEELAAFSAGKNPTLTALGHSGSFAVTDGESGNTWLVDSGLGLVSHGDHSDVKEAEPSISDVVATGEKPTHVERSGTKTAIYYDGTGATAVYTDIELMGDNPQPFITKAAAAPHHGVAVPRQDGFLLTMPDENLPLGVASYDDKGNLIAEFPECPGLHGAAVLKESVVFGCTDGLLEVTEAGGSVKHEYPAKGEDRVGAFAHPAESDATLIFGRYGQGPATTVLIADLAEGSTKTVDVGAPFRAMLDLGDNVGAVLTTNGDLVLFDIKSGKVTETVAAIDAWEVPEGHGGVMPDLAFSHDFVYITDPVNKTVVEISRDDLATRTIDVGVAGAKIAVSAPEGEHHDL
ncbi:hypothetical protein G7067_13135 [Leucobacter insecticola]|uniref:Lipoprotein n=1 Tax=Leucobacter insecticola TaxID=2714934 RepID=A0A6G8FLH1_9MICO|nr:hypothetical protein [Leucobacter insecticola]QIM17139.1 hypothetical protein G7067_13135 [Leucobacter insecticola]